MTLQDLVDFFRTRNIPEYDQQYFFEIHRKDNGLPLIDSINRTIQEAQLDKIPINPNVGRFDSVRIGDLHGEFLGLLTILRNAGIIDIYGRYIPGNNGRSLIGLGDYIDRGIQSVEVIFYLLNLLVQAAELRELIYIDEFIDLCAGNHELEIMRNNAAFFDANKYWVPLETTTKNRKIVTLFSALRDLFNACLTKGDFKFMIPDRHYDAISVHAENNKLIKEMYIYSHLLIKGKLTAEEQALFNHLEFEIRVRSSERFFQTFSITHISDEYSDKQYIKNYVNHRLSSYPTGKLRNSVLNEYLRNNNLSYIDICNWGNNIISTYFTFNRYMHPSDFDTAQKLCLLITWGRAKFFENARPTVDKTTTFSAHSIINEEKDGGVIMRKGNTICQDTAISRFYHERYPATSKLSYTAAIDGKVFACEVRFEDRFDENKWTFRDISGQDHKLTKLSQTELSKIPGNKVAAQVPVDAYNSYTRYMDSPLSDDAAFADVTHLPEPQISLD